MIPQEVIRTKRDGGVLSRQDIEAFIAGLTGGTVTEGQAAAFAMAVFFRGMSETECADLTRAMTHSGHVLDWRTEALPGPVLDKHSTGGVGDVVSLMLAPMVAACGGYVPMISGRGLGHTGGTLDKLESIRGYCAVPDEARFRRTVREAGCAIIGQTEALAPADRRLYAIRDVTATVESIPLITASILSKKLAAGLDGLVMDVKTGSGAFMPSLEQARALAASIVGVAREAGLPTRALITDMDAPLASSAGNALEVRLAIDYLTGLRRESRLYEVVLALGASMLVLGGLAGDEAQARARLLAALETGAAAERFARMVVALGGPSDLLERPDRHLPAAPVRLPVEARETGRVRTIATRAIGMAVVGLGGGRTRPQDGIDPAVGLSDLAALGSEVGAGRPLAIVHARSMEAAEAAAEAVRAAYALDADAPPERPAVLDAIGG